MITGPQCRAGRALVEITRDTLASHSHVDKLIIKQFEHKIEMPGPTAISALQTALEEFGAVFIPENGGGIGVRLKFSQSETKRIARLESEGGTVASDDVP
jgi:hypothetical protein